MVNNVIVANKQFAKFLTGFDLPETPRVDRQVRRHSISSPTAYPSLSHSISSGNTSLTIKDWLAAHTTAPEARCINLEDIQEKFQAVDFLDCLVTMFRGLPQDQWKEEFHFTLKERGFLCNALAKFSGK